MSTLPRRRGSWPPRPAATSGWRTTWAPWCMPSWPPRRRSGMPGGARMRSARWVTAVLVTLVFPVAALFGGIAYLVLRHKWSDRLVAAVLTVAGAVATWYTVTALNYWGAWLHVAVWAVRLSHRAPATGEWSTLAGIG